MRRTAKSCGKKHKRKNENDFKNETKKTFVDIGYNRTT